MDFKNNILSTSVIKDTSNSAILPVAIEIGERSDKSYTSGDFIYNEGIYGELGAVLGCVVSCLTGRTVGDSVYSRYKEKTD